MKTVRTGYNSILDRLPLYRRLSIRVKLIGIIMLSTVVALMLASSAFLLYEMAMYQESVSHELSIISQLVAISSVAAIEFRDTNASTETLAALRGEPRIELARLYGKDGRVLADYRRPGAVAQAPAVAGEPRVIFGEGRVELLQFIGFNGAQSGALYLRRDLKDRDARLWQYAGIMASALFMALCGTLLVSTLLQRVISVPLHQLAEITARVTGENDYSLRARKLADDELGAVVDRFNQMMDRIHSRDEQLRRAQDELEERVEDRTRELQQEIGERKRVELDLIGSKEAAEESNRAKSAFLANMSHELRTPLNAIIGYSEMLSEDAVAEGNRSAAADLEKIRSSGKHLLMLINDVLDISKIEAGKMTFQMQWTPIGQMVREATGTAEPLARKNNNRLEVIYEEKGERIYTDEIKFRQSLLNLLSNACKFTQNGTVELIVGSTRHEGKDWFLWSVRDTGIGISPEQTARLFQSFSQVDSSATRKFGGTGLGLAISRRLCQTMGGDITMESAPGQGSTFTIRYPMKPPDGDTEAEETETGEDQSGATEARKAELPAEYQGEFDHADHSSR